MKNAIIIKPKIVLKFTILVLYIETHFPDFSNILGGISRSNLDILILFWSIVGHPGYVVNLDVSHDNFCKCTAIFVIVYSLLQVKPRTKTAVTISFKKSAATISFQHKG